MPPAPTDHETFPVLFPVPVGPQIYVGTSFGAFVSQADSQSVVHSGKKGRIA